VYRRVHVVVRMRRLKSILWSLLMLAVGLGIVYWVVPASRLWDDADAKKTYVDMHVHVGCVGAGGSGCFLSPELSDNFRFNFYLLAFDVVEEELEREGDAVVVAKLSDKIAASIWVDKAVVLAMDGAVTDGELDLSKTQVYIPNEFLARELAPFENLVFGASVNPYRTDALQRLERVKAQGAVLIKWIPAIMGIDPSDERLIPFYDKLVELDLPLLSHAGQERSFAYADDALGDPLRLVLPLERGVTVIAAHIATTGQSEGEDNFQRILPLFQKYPNLYADISSLTQINKIGYLKEALEQPHVVERLIYGSDYPLQFFPLVSPLYQLPDVPLEKLKAIQALESLWDRDVALKKAMGVPDSVFDRSADLLGL